MSRPRAHTVIVNQTSREVVDDHNSHQPIFAGAPQGAKVGEDVRVTSRDGVGFQGFVAATTEAGDMLVRIRG